MDAARREHAFFFAMSMLIAAIVFVGFARTYFLAGYFQGPPLPGPIVHVHGAVFTAWILLLAVQASLVSAGRTHLHRRLGLLGLGLAPLVVILGIAVANEMVTRVAHIRGFDGEGIYAVALSEAFGFAVPVAFALGLRRRRPVHKRLMLIGTIAMTTAGFGRWPIDVLLHRPFPAMLAAFTLLLLVGVYDLVSLGRLHRATVMGGAWVIFIELISLPVGHTAVWAALVSRVRLFWG